ncbi:MAG: undecaprenyldiphospho-muramoylpentapeptide beta-N-acetylglucosaminyltransferase [Candidatus Omnitrophota bacterium]
MINKKILIVCGGSGGHIFPAISLAEELNNRGYDISFITDASKIAKYNIDSGKYKSSVLSVPKMPYNFSIKWVLFIWQLLVSFFSALKLVSFHNPKLVIGFGAYISGPVLLAAKLSFKKVAIHEQNAVLGRANKLLLPYSDKVFLSYKHMAIEYKKRYVFTGNPLRKKLTQIYKSMTKREAVSFLKLSDKKKTLMVLGGSSGASFINSVMLAFIGSISDEERSMLQIVHLTGSKTNISIGDFYREKGVLNWTRDFCDDMGILYKASDLLLCRAGATTVSEAAFFGLPSIFIPYTGAANHQIKNAAFLKENKAAEIVEEKYATPVYMRKLIFSLLNDEHTLLERSRRMRECSIPDASNRIADNLDELLVS